MKKTLNGLQKSELGQIITSWLLLPKLDNGFVSTANGDLHTDSLYTLMCDEIDESFIELKPSEMTEKEKTTIGQQLVDFFELTPNANERYDMHGGDKTPLGLFLTLHYRFELHLSGTGQIINF